MLCQDGPRRKQNQRYVIELSAVFILGRSVRRCFLRWRRVFFESTILRFQVLQNTMNQGGNE